MQAVRAGGSAGGNELLIFPCNGNAIEALDCLDPGLRMIGFVDDAPDKRGTERHGHPVLDRRALTSHPDARVLAVPGGPQSYRSRRALIESLGVAPSRFVTVIHSGARISPLAQIGHNVLFMAGVVVTSNAIIGNHVCVLPNTVIHHDARIGSWTLVGSNVTIAGGVAVGDNCYIASGTSIKHDVVIGEMAMVGLGSTVIADIPANAVYAGNPARSIR